MENLDHHRLPLESVLGREWVKIPGWHDDVWHLSGLSDASNFFYNVAQISRCKRTKEISYAILGERYGETGEHGELNCLNIQDAKRELIQKIKAMYSKGFYFYE